MGQFLAIGLVTQIGVKRKEINATHLTLEHLQERMKHEFYYAPEIYVVSEHDDVYYFKLNDDIFYTQLLPLLETLYPLLYKNTAYDDHILQKLHTLPPSEWIPWAKGKSEEAFQFDQYGMGDSIQEKHTNIHIYYESLLLSMEGKIVMEEYGRQFNFVKYTRMHTFRQFCLSGALRIYITG